MKKILLVCYEAGHFIELFRISQFLKETGRFQPILTFALQYVELPKHVSMCQEQGIKILAVPGKVIIEMESGPRNESSVTVFPDFRFLGINPYRLPKLPRFLFFRFYDVYSFVTKITGLRAVKGYWREVKTIRQVLNEQSPALLILPEDNLSHRTQIWVLEGLKQKIQTLITPYTVYNAVEIAAFFYRLPQYTLTTIEAWIAKLFFPQWLYRQKGSYLIRLPRSEMLTTLIFGGSPPIPWMGNSGSSAAIAVESQAMMKYYQREGLPENQLVLTGGLYDDILAKTLQNKTTLKKQLYEKNGLNPDRPLILVAVPPRFNDRTLSRSQFQSNEELIEFWVDSVSDMMKRFNVLYRLHPRAPQSTAEIILRKGGRIVDQDTASLVPLSDLYIASISATIRWAIACGIPVINFDPCRHELIDFVEVPGVLTLETKEQFLGTLKEIQSNPSYFEQLQQDQALHQKQWGNLDGQSANRLLSLIDRLAK